MNRRDFAALYLGLFLSVSRCVQMDKIARVNDLLGIIVENRPENTEVIVSKSDRIKDKIAIQKKSNQRRQLVGLVREWRSL
jgi:hypothetical protein